MIHFGKLPNEDKIVIEVSDGDLLHLHRVLLSMPLPERRSFFGIKELIETDAELCKYLESDAPAASVPPMASGDKQISRSDGKGGSYAVL